MKARSPYLFSMLGLLAGGIAGASIALLLAPQSGRSTRQMMARKVSGGAGSVRSLGDRVVARGEEIWEETAHRVGDAASALSGTLDRKPGNGDDAPSG